jgi:hypothetical protein
MNTLNITLSYSYISGLTNVTWNDILYGIQKGYLPNDSAIEYAVDVIKSESNVTDTVLELASLFKGESISPYIECLSQEIDSQNDEVTKDKFLYILLHWIYEHQELYSDQINKDYPNPLYAIEAVYDDFGFPKSISHLIYYLPTTEPKLKSVELNTKRLYERWKEYLDAQRVKYKGVSDDN